MAADGRPGVLVFDVNETLTDMTPLAARLADIGLPGQLLPVWFAGVLRDGIALSLAGGRATFAEVAGDVLRTLLARHGPGGADPAVAVDHVLTGLPELPVHPDVPEGVRALRAAGHRLVTLTNGSADTTRAVLDRAGCAVPVASGSPLPPRTPTRCVRWTCRPARRRWWRCTRGTSTAPPGPVSPPSGCGARRFPTRRRRGPPTGRRPGSRIWPGAWEPPCPADPREVDFAHHGVSGGKSSRRGIPARAGRLAGDALEGAAEGGLRSVAEALRHCLDRQRVLGQPLAGEEHPQFGGVAEG